MQKMLVGGDQEYCASIKPSLKMQNGIRFICVFLKIYKTFSLFLWTYNSCFAEVFFFFFIHCDCLCAHPKAVGHVFFVVSKATKMLVMVGLCAEIPLAWGAASLHQ